MCSMHERANIMLTKRMPTSSAFHARLQLGVQMLLLLLLLALGPVAYGQVASPCPSIFNYRLDANTNQVYGMVQLYNLRIGQVVKLQVDLSIGFAVPQRNVGSITLIKSKQQTFLDIANNKPALYRVNLPFRNAFPNLLAIRVNGIPICYGQKAKGQIVTTINLDHTLVTQAVSNNVNALQIQRVQQTPRPVVYTPPVQIQPQPQIVQTRLQPVQPRPQPVQPRPQPVQPRPQPAQPRPQPVQPRPQPVQVKPKPVQPKPQSQAQPRPQPAKTKPQSVPKQQKVQTTRRQPQSNDVCGMPSPVYNRLSIRGKLTPKGQFPWTVPIFENRNPKKPTYICGSTILNKYHLVTAGHCMYDDYKKFRAADLLAIPGMYNIADFKDPDIQMHDVVTLIVHPDYYFDDEGSAENDIALMVLEQPIKYNDLVRPICLWGGSGNIADIVDKSGFVSGWGVTENGKAQRPSYVRAKVVSNRECRRKLPRFSQGKGTFCADGKGEVPCSGDSGSGLVFNQGSQFFIRGVVSVGQLDPYTLLCDTTKYVVYTDIVSFRPWLLKEMSSFQQ